MKSAKLMAVVGAAVLACAGGPAKRTPTGNVVMRVQPAALLAAQVTRIAVTVAPIGLSQDLTANADGSFSGVLVVPPGTYTVGATAYAGTVLAGTGSAGVTVVANQTAAVTIRILDATPPAPVPDHAPIITALSASSTNPVAGDVVTLAATAVDPDQDPIAYAWTQSQGCAGTFGSPAAAATTWTSTTVGTCTLTLTVNSKQLADAVSVNVTVSAKPAPTGTIDVSAVFVSQPQIESVTVRDLLPNAAPACYVWRQGPGADATCHMPVSSGETVAVEFALSSVATGAKFELVDDCHGTAAQATPGAPSFTWKAPGTGGVCALTARVTQDGLVDTLPVAIFVSSCLEDAFEHNDTLATASPVALAPTVWSASNLALNEDDWFSVTPPDSNFGVVVAAAAPVPVELVDAGGTVVAKGTSGLKASVTAGARYYVHVVAPSVSRGACGPTYSLTMQSAAFAGTYVDTYVTTMGPVTVPHDLTAAAVEAFDVNDARYVGHGGADGVFWFDLGGVAPAGPLALHVADQWHVARAPFVELGGVYEGRRDATYPSTSTPLTVTVANLAPWSSAADDLQLFDSNGFGYDVGMVSTPPSDGATSATVTYDPFAYGFALVDASRGDGAVISQVEPFVSSSGLGYGVVTRSGVLSPVVQVDGVPGAASALVSPVATRTFTPVLAPSFAAVAAQAARFAPAATPAMALVAVEALPFAESFGAYAGAPQLSAMYLPKGASDPGALVYGDAFAGATRFVYAQRNFRSALSAPGATSPTSIAGFSIHVGGLGDAIDLMAPVQGVTIDGQDALAPAAPVSATPTFSWSPPADTRAKTHRFTVAELVVDATGATQIGPSSLFTTEQTTVKLPPGLLRSGATYVLFIHAMSAPPTAPWRTAMPFADSRFVSAPFQVK
jgi:hypothetical protein